jgi:flagellar secretion chaperone FliS
LAYANYAFEYQKQAVSAASPVGLIVILYDGALRFMEAGKAAMKSGDLNNQNTSLQRAQKIVLHLMATLDLEKGGIVAANLMSLYSYVLDQLVQANVHDQPDKIDLAIQTFSQLRSGWSQLDERQKQNRGELIAA